MNSAAAKRSIMAWKLVAGNLTIARMKRIREVNAEIMKKSIVSFKAY